MAKLKFKESKHDSAVKFMGESPFGSHASMVKEYLEEGKVVLVDEKGEYITYVDRLDNGLADPRRFERV